MNAFNRLAPFIQDFIYSNGWSELRGNQVAAIEAIFDTDCNLLLSSGTASGKTEAAFLPILTELHNNPSSSVGALYISPLKALINDQFIRLEQLILQSDIPVCKWHGDASVSKKNALAKNPKGILQITPESLESLLINKRGACLKMFGDLRFIIIDEVHHFMRDARGVQVLCLLERLQRLTNNIPRRIGLSATLGDIKIAEGWLNNGTERECITPITDEGKKLIKLHVNRFVSTNSDNDESNHDDSGEREHFEYLFKMTLDKKTIIFTNSREETEYTLAHLREIAIKNKSPDVYRVHHGNVSANLREQTEEEMKTSDEKIVTGATVTLELGIDIGSLDQVVHIGSPMNVASFAQRLGRCGRRGQTPQLLFSFVEHIDTTAADLLGPINWSFIRTIAIIELYTKEKWLEPLHPHDYPFALLYHQTMSHLVSNGGISAAQLAQYVLSLECFKNIPQSDYKLLLNHMLDTEHLQQTEEGGIIIGRKGEQITSNFHFYTVFIVPDYYLVKDENKTIGTVDKIYPVGIRFSLAGMTWETIAVNENAKVIFVKNVPGVSIVDWNVDFEFDMHTVLLRKMRDVLQNNEAYPYLSESCSERLNEIRYLCQNSGILTNLVTPVSEHKFAVFPWVGTRQLVTLHYLLLGRYIKSNMLWNSCIYLEVYFNGSADELEDIIHKIMAANIDMYELPLPDNASVISKYNDYVPKGLLRKQYIEDYLDFQGLRDALSC